MDRHDPSDTLKAVAASLVLVDHVLEPEGATMGKLVEATDFAKSTAHAHLKMLTKYGYVVSIDNEYHLGTELCHLGNYVRTRKDYYRVTQRTVSQFDSESSIDADFAVEEHGRIISLHGDPEFVNMPHFLIDGSPFHVHTMCSGKAIIVEYPEARVREITDRWGLPAVTDGSITTEDELFAELMTVRGWSYAENSDEAVEEFWAIGRAVESPRGEVYGSLNLSNPVHVIDEETQATQVELLEHAVGRFEQDVVELYQTQASEPNEE